MTTSSTSGSRAGGGRAGGGGEQVERRVRRHRAQGPEDRPGHEDVADVVGTHDQHARCTAARRGRRARDGARRGGGAPRGDRARRRIPGLLAGSPAVSWFRTRPLARDVWLVAEPGHVNSWLVAGRDRAVLVDSGLGIAPIRTVVEALTDRPVDVVHTHAHLDHVGGDAEFSRVAIHPAGVPELTAGASAAERRRYLAHTRRMLAAADAYRALDRDFFHLLSADSDPRPLPPGVDETTWGARAGARAGPARRGGCRRPRRSGAGRPAHARTLARIPSASSTSGNGLLFAGGHDQHRTDLRAGARVRPRRVRGLHRAARRARRGRAPRAHGALRARRRRGRLPAPVAGAFACLLAGDAVVRPARDCDDDPVRKAVFDACSIYVPSEG